MLVRLLKEFFAFSDTSDSHSGNSVLPSRKKKSRLACEIFPNSRVLRRKIVTHNAFCTFRRQCGYRQNEIQSFSSSCSFSLSFRIAPQRSAICAKGVTTTTNLPSHIHDPTRTV